MGKAVERAQTLISLKAGETLPAYRVVRVSAANTVSLYDTTTSLIFGVTADDSVAGTGSSVKVAIAGTVKCTCVTSISAGALVAPQSATASGLISEAGATLANTTTSEVPKTLGIALQAGSTNSVIEVALSIENHSKVAYS